MTLFENELANGLRWQVGKTLGEGIQQCKKNICADSFGFFILFFGDFFIK
jgi:hypothetical protein